MKLDVASSRNRTKKPGGVTLRTNDTRQATLTTSPGTAPPPDHSALRRTSPTAKSPIFIFPTRLAANKMCHGDLTQLACGHTLQHITSCEDPATACAIVWERHTLRDTCAACDPSILKRELTAQYEERHAVLMGQMLKARRQGDEDAVRILSNVERRLLTRHREKMMEVLELERYVGVEVSCRE